MNQKVKLGTGLQRRPSVLSSCTRFVVPAMGVLFALCSLSSSVQGQPTEPDKATQEAARTLGRAGLALYDKGNWKEALEKFTQAYNLYAAPTLGLLAARCHAKLGHLVAAAQLYQEVSQLGLDASASPAFVRAKKDAAKEREKLMARVPKLTISMDEPDPEARVTLDGVALSSSAVGTAQMVDTGTHEVIVERKGVQRKERVTIKEGEHRRVVFNFRQQTPTTNIVDEPSTSDEPGLGAQRVIGIVALGVGAVGLGIGFTFAGIAAGQRGKLDDSNKCVEGVCSQDLDGDVKAYNTSRIVSGVGILGGILAVATGGTLLLTAPEQKSVTQGTGGSTSQGVWISPQVGFGSIGVAGRF